MKGTKGLDIEGEAKYYRMGRVPLAGVQAKKKRKASSGNHMGA
jgi:hypothetical protein